MERFYEVLVCPACGEQVAEADDFGDSHCSAHGTVEPVTVKLGLDFEPGDTFRDRYPSGRTVLRPKPSRIYPSHT